VEKGDRKTGLPPLVRPDAHTLILGTMPGDDSLRVGRYYANPRNQFWDILSAVYNTPVPAEYEARAESLLSRGIALWDVCQSGTRAGSLDSDLRDELPNDLGTFLVAYSNIDRIGFNGGKAQRLFKKHFSTHDRVLPKIGTWLLPSTSGTPGRYVLSLDEKLLRWREFLAR
jgi:TDG/mug DNA glycosylase family protein